MRLLIENYGDAVIYKEYSSELFNTPLRWVVEWNNGSTQIYNTNWYSLEKVKSFVECQLLRTSPV